MTKLKINFFMTGGISIILNQAQYNICEYLTFKVLITYQLFI